MTKLNNQYGEVALVAINNMKTTPGIHPRKAWQKAAAKLIESISSREKGCPRSTFLGLCEAGLMKGIPVGNYLNQKTNNAFAVKAFELLKNNSLLEEDKKELWNQVI